MKTLTSVGFAIAILLAFCCGATAQTMRTDTLNVAGNCSMCKKRIESPFKDRKGVESATWDKKAKTFVITYDEASIKREEIRDLIVKQGYDADGKIASDEVYAKLPNCCKYRDGGAH
ncbi:MAG: heavy-metal-associated domain-containing protein [Candidatus Kapaibacterium sp.]